MHGNHQMRANISPKYRLIPRHGGPLRWPSDACGLQERKEYMNTYEFLTKSDAVAFLHSIHEPVFYGGSWEDIDDARKDFDAMEDGQDFTIGLDEGESLESIDDAIRTLDAYDEVSDIDGSFATIWKAEDDGIITALIPFRDGVKVNVYITKEWIVIEANDMKISKTARAMASWESIYNGIWAAYGRYIYLYRDPLQIHA